MDKKMKSLLTFVLEMFVMAAATFAIFTYVVKPIHIQGSSMKPTVYNNDLAVVNVLGLKMNGVQRFDVVIVNSNRISDHLIKRVIGLPGETVEYKDDVLYIDGQRVDEPFLDQDFMSQSIAEAHTTNFTYDFSYTLQDDEYFVMGDNRLHSEDSRGLGPFHIDEFLGKNGFTIFPFNHFGWIK